MTRHFVQAINIVVLRSGKVNMNVYIRNSKILLDIMRPHSPTPMLRIEIHLMNRTCKRKQSLLQQQQKTCSVYTNNQASTFTNLIVTQTNVFKTVTDFKSVLYSK